MVWIRSWQHSAACFQSKPVLHSVECVEKMNEMGVVYVFGMVPCQLGFAGAIELSKLRVWGLEKVQFVMLSGQVVRNDLKK
jgi:hypothetical protein